MPWTKVEFEPSQIDWINHSNDTYRIYGLLGSITVTDTLVKYGPDTSQLSKVNIVSVGLIAV